MRQLSGLDAGFLSIETPEAPMLIAGVSLLDPRTPSGRLTVDRLRGLLSARLDRAPALRRRLAAAPLGLTRPHWVELATGEVDFDAHVERTELPAPGGWHELGELVAWEMSRPLDRGRPLWQMVFVEGVRAVPGAPADAVALIAKVHHAAIDGVSGNEILAALFDGAPEGTAPEAPPESPAPEAPSKERPAEKEPGALRRFGRAGRDLASASLAAPGVVGRSLRGLGAGAWSRLRAGAPPLPFTAPRTPFNHPLSGHRAWAPAFLDLARVKAVKDAAAATVNDVVLALCAGALRAWLDERGELPERPLVAMVPVSVRAGSERGRGGNLVSAMLVELATEVADPLERLLRIRDAARSSKAAHRTVGARTLLEAADLLPFGLSGLAARAYSRWHLSELHRPLFNLVITNVPGPQRPLTLDGAPLLAYVGAAPLADGLRLILPVYSYRGTLSIGVTADREAMPDPAGFAVSLEGALDELEAAVGAARKP